MRISELTEDEIISELQKRVPRGPHTVVPSGDDSAVYALEGATTLSVDMLAEGRHFKREWSSAFDIGRRAAAQNIADAVAIGAAPRSLVVGMALPVDLELDWLLEFADGMAQVCEPLGVGIDGGDLVGGDSIVISVSIVGDLEGREPTRRNGLQIDDAIIFAGTLGNSMAGLRLLEAGYTREDEDFAGLIDDFLAPKPPFEVALAAARSGVRAMMDISDGFVKDARRMAKASGVWLDIDDIAVDKLIGPIAKAAGRLGAERREWAYTGGEDHGFLAAVPKGTPIPEGFVRVGKVRGAAHGGRVTVSGREVNSAGGWDHFKSAEPGPLF